jgi:hypothetical protein
MIALIITGTRAELQPNHTRVIRETVAHFMREHGEPSVVIHGACPTGVDAFVAERFALVNQGRWRKGDVEILILPLPADWTRHSKAAGPVRNTAMVQLGKCLRDGSTYEVHWLAFPLGFSPGTRDCARKCETAGFAGRVVELEVANGS